MALPLVSNINSYFTLSQTYSNLNLCRKTKSIMAIDRCNGTGADATVQEQMQRYRSGCNRTGADATVQDRCNGTGADATVQEQMQPYISGYCILYFAQKPSASARNFYINGPTRFSTSNFFVIRTKSLTDRKLNGYKIQLKLPKLLTTSTHNI